MAKGERRRAVAYEAVPSTEPSRWPNRSSKVIFQRKQDINKIKEL